MKQESFSDIEYSCRIGGTFGAFDGGNESSAKRKRVLEE